MLVNGKQKTAIQERKEEFQVLILTLPKSWTKTFMIKKYGKKAKQIMADLYRIENARCGKVALTRAELNTIKKLVQEDNSEVSDDSNTAEVMP